MSKLEDIVPPLELCKRIPAGSFEDSAFCWQLKTPTFTCGWTGAIQPVPGWTVTRSNRRRIEICRERGEEICPAPTLAEILADMPKSCIGKYPSAEWLDDVSEWLVRCFTPGAIVSERDANPAAAALRLWLKINAGNVANEFGG